MQNRTPFATKIGFLIKEIFTSNSNSILPGDNAIILKDNPFPLLGKVFTPNNNIFSPGNKSIIFNDSSFTPNDNLTFPDKNPITPDKETSIPYKTLFARGGKRPPSPSNLFISGAVFFH